MWNTANGLSICYIYDSNGDLLRQVYFQNDSNTNNRLHEGGRLMAFAYRFGDSFTQSNLRDLFGPLGCYLNDNAVINTAVLRETHPLQIHFDTPGNSSPLPWLRAGVQTVRWRPCATFTILPRTPVWPLVFSPGGSCLSFDRTLRQISFESLPIAVIGKRGRGRFALFGGPHQFETSLHGLLGEAENARFLQNVLDWLLSERSDEPKRMLLERAPARDFGDFVRLEAGGKNEVAIASVERLLRKTGVLKALSRAKWLP